MTASPEFALQPDRMPPERTGIVVIGGGVVGVTAALMMAQWGIPVVLCEKGRIAGEQSSRNWGWIRLQGRDLREVPLMLEAQALWRQFGERCAQDFGLRQKGIAYVAATDAELAEHEAWLESVKPFQLTSRMLNAAETDALIGRDDRAFRGAILTPTDMHAEPALAVPALARLAAAEGAQIFERLAVRTLETAGGRVTGVITEAGRIDCSGVILAGGAWCRPFLENLGLSLPQLAVRSQAQRTAPAPRIADGPIGTPMASIRPRLDGGYTLGRTRAARFDLIPAAFTHFLRYLPLLRDRWRMVKIRLGPEFFGALGRHRWGPDQFSPMEQARVLDPVPDARLLDSILAEAQRIFPKLQGVPVVERWGGMIEVSPDEVPLLGEVGGLEGLTLATGLSGHGFGLGPGLGLLAAQLATGREPVADPAPFAVDRFHRRRGAHGAV
ncbi:MAG: FAD-binding oxidoreductase [Alphaproteobacteria bacterium]|nr:MAG: FAD-binding oxidoreductase [Alphaproteobacteria bacterium]